MPKKPESRTIVKSPFMRVALALWSMAGALVALLLAISLLQATPGDPKPPRVVAAAAVAEPTPVRDTAKKPASSSMLRASGYAIAKDKLD